MHTTDEAHEPRLHDPAHRDQDGLAWHGGRFAERVRRQWNGVTLRMSGRPGEPELEELAQAIHAQTGGDLAEVRARLQEFAALDDSALSAPPASDPLLRPGAGDQPL